jgi:hypothetical protein
LGSTGDDVAEAAERVADPLPPNTSVPPTTESRGPPIIRPSGAATIEPVVQSATTCCCSSGARPDCKKL